jgi:hypothetical protein
MNTAGDSQRTKCRQGGRGRFHFHLCLPAGIILSLLLASASFGASATRMLNAKFPTIQFDDVGLENVIDFLRNSTRVNFYVDWKSLAAAGVTPKTPVTLKLHAMPMRTALTFILRSAGGTVPLSWRVDENIIQISGRAAADLQLIRRVYPVEDLLMLVPDFTDAPDFDLSSLAQSGSAKGGSSGDNLFGNTSQQREKPLTQRDRAEELIQLITSTIRPEIWRRNGGPASINYFNGSLIVLAPADVQAKISGF